MLDNARLNEKYRIEKMIGNGSFSIVYRATERHCDRKVAIKALQRDVYDASSHEYAESELSAMGRLWEHENIVTVHTVEPGDDEFIAFIVMEYVEDGSLRRRMQNGPLPLQDALAFTYDICNALAYAHERFVVHRDIKPRNVLITSDGVAKVSDFGVAQVQEAPHDFPSTFAGTRRYMAPEQYEDTYDATVDVFAAGILLWEMALGAFPYEGRTHDQIRESKATDPVPPPDLPEPVRAILQRSLRADPFARFRTMEEMREAVETALMSIYRSVAERRLASGDPLEIIESQLSPLRASLRISTSTAHCIDELAVRHVEETVRQEEEKRNRERTVQLSNELVENICRRKIAEADVGLRALIEADIVDPLAVELIETLWHQIKGPAYVGRVASKVGSEYSTAKPRKLDPCPDELYDAADDESTALALRESGQQYERESRWRKARGAYRKSARMYAERAGAARREGHFVRAAKFYQRAGEAYRDAQDKRKPQAHFQLAGDCWSEHAGQYESANTREYCAKTYRAAAQAYDQAEDADNADAKYQSAATQLYEAARDYRRSGDLRAAESSCRQAVDLSVRTSRWELTDVARQLLYQIRAERVKPVEEDDAATDVAV